MTLYRPVGLKELELIAALNFQAFPPRLPIQSIFYPVLNYAYAAQIARDWNTKDIVSGFVGFVTRFEVDDVYAAQFEVQTVGNQQHQELWVTAEDLAEFNRHILGEITVETAFQGEQFAGELDPQTHLPRNLR